MIRQNSQPKALPIISNADCSSDGSIIVTSIDELTTKTIEILRREILNLMGESTRGKLEPSSSKALVDYIKLLSDLKDKEKDLLAQLPDEYLEKLARK